MDRLIVDAVAAGANRVDEVAFDVRDKPALRDEARRHAVAAARRKAEVYAEAAGVPLGPALHIRDVDPETLYQGGHGRGPGPSSADGTLAPGSVEVNAAVVLGFSLGR